MTESVPTNVRAKTALARLAIGFERVWAAMLWPLVVLAGVAAILASGLLPTLPGWARLTVLAALGLSFLVSLRALLRVRWPTSHEAMRRIEAGNGLPHRPVSAHDDRIAGDASPAQRAIWEEHRARQLRSLARLKVGTPRSAWRDLDPVAVRVPVLLALVVAILLGQGDPRNALTDSIAMSRPAEVQAVAIDAWLRPPAYTGTAPILLTGPAMSARLAVDPEIVVPDRSVLSLRVTNAEAPAISFHEPGDDGIPSGRVSDVVARTDLSGNQFKAEATLTRPVVVVITDRGREIARWSISLLPDAAPTIKVTATPTGDASGTLSVPWKVTDDYGVTAITSDLYLADAQDGGIGFESNGIFRFDPPKLAVPLRNAAAREEAGTAKAQLAEHPWAGFMLDMTLTARDAAGNATESETVTFRLPERQFTRLLARALVEQRRNLILDPAMSGHVVQMLDALLTYPEGLIEGSGTHIAIAAVRSHLSHARSPADVDDAIAMLWQIAVGIEDGRVADARAALDALRKELERALREGAPPERIAELMDRLREAMDRYMQSLTEEARRRMGQGQMDDSGRQMQQQGQAITPQDLQKMLDMIEQLARSGANEAAEQLLSQLEDILRNLQPGMGQMQQGQQGDSSLGQMLDQLSDLMRQQQQLMDETQRGPQPGQNGADEGRQGLSDLGDRQRGLGETLRGLLEQFGQNGIEAPRALGEAGDSMQGAEGSLRQGDRDGALGQQGEALAKLREGAQGLARQMMQQGQGQQGSQGRHGEARGDDRDPLGRPLPSRGEDYGPDRNMLPTESAIQRAREILEQLRARAGETGLPRIERDYIERLLRGLY